jgi:alkylhydroperoxidase/carboxymuconolactone decarboxylase family protein YurZ
MQRRMHPKLPAQPPPTAAAADRRLLTSSAQACSASLPACPGPAPVACLQLTDDLKNFLITNLPKVKKDGKAKFKLGVAEAKLGSAIQVGTHQAVLAVAAAAWAAAADTGLSCSKQMRGHAGGTIDGHACRPLQYLSCSQEEHQSATAAVAPVAGWQQGRGAACAHLVLLLSLLLQEETSVPCECNEYIGELLRGVRQHLST